MEEEENATRNVSGYSSTSTGTTIHSHIPGQANVIEELCQQRSNSLTLPLHIKEEQSPEDEKIEDYKSHPSTPPAARLDEDLSTTPPYNMSEINKLRFDNQHAHSKGRERSLRTISRNAQEEWDCVRQISDVQAVNYEKLLQSIFKRGEMCDAQMHLAIHERDSCSIVEERLKDHAQFDGSIKAKLSALRAAKDAEVDEAMIQKRLTRDQSEVWANTILTKSDVDPPTLDLLKTIMIEDMLPKESRSAQVNWKSAAIKSLGFEGKGGYVWCPISRIHSKHDTITAAHIVPFALGKSTMQTIFGTDDDYPYAIGNCLPMHSRFERAWDKGKFLLQQVEHTNPPDYRIVLLDLSVKKIRTDRHDIETDDWTWGDIDGRILEFPTKARPKARYMYFNYVSKLLFASAQAKGEKGHGFRQGLERFQSSGEVWATPGKYMRRGFICHMGVLVGETLSQKAIEACTIDETDEIVDERQAKRRKLNNEAAAEQYYLWRKLENEIEKSDIPSP